MKKMMIKEDEDVVIVEEKMKNEKKGGRGERSGKVKQNRSLEGDWIIFSSPSVFSCCALDSDRTTRTNQ